MVTPFFGAAGQSGKGWPRPPLVYFIFSSDPYILWFRTNRPPQHVYLPLFGSISVENGVGWKNV